ncbi:hypothetical protein ACFE04_005219 [Oxalis oulophora]
MASSNSASWMGRGGCGLFVWAYNENEQAVIIDLLKKMKIENEALMKEVHSIKVEVGEGVISGNELVMVSLDSERGRVRSKEVKGGELGQRVVGTREDKRRGPEKRRRPEKEVKGPDQTTTRDDGFDRDGDQRRTHWFDCGPEVKGRVSLGGGDG